MVWRPDEVDAQGSGNGQDWTGIKNVGIIGFQDRAAEFDWADVLIDIELDVEGSDFTRTMSVSGEFEKDHDGNLQYNSLVKRVYTLMDSLGCKAGIDMQGKWVDEGGEPISDIGAYLSALYAQPAASVKHDKLAFVYNKVAKAGAVKKDGTPREYYTNVWPRLWPIGPEGKKEADSFVAFMRKGNKLKEFTQDTQQGNVQEALSTQVASAMNL